MAVKNIIEVKGVSKYYLKHKALNNIDLNVKKGSVFGLLGPNGAGKTTLIRIINQILIADSGSIKINGDCKTKKAGVMTYHSTDCSGKGKKSLLLSKLDGTCQLLEDGMKIPSKAEGIRATCNN